MGPSRRRPRDDRRVDVARRSRDRRAHVGRRVGRRARRRVGGRRAGATRRSRRRSDVRPAAVVVPVVQRVAGVAGAEVVVVVPGVTQVVPPGRLVVGVPVLAPRPLEAVVPQLHVGVGQGLLTLDLVAEQLALLLVVLGGVATARGERERTEGRRRQHDPDYQLARDAHGKPRPFTPKRLGCRLLDRYSTCQKHNNGLRASHKVRLALLPRAMKPQRGRGKTSLV
ncbi:hypothetical protein [Ktedonospora formicarum]|uniref:hypothetical protein n=1 Tax=Ktedonospora formicarum TaxID=2778364 RepID=UPI001C68DE2B|nr:hypothetical protein [Ktedonospora formicarum]